MRRALFTTIAATVLVSSSASAEEDAKPTEYVVKKGDTCSTIAATAFGDVKRIDLVHVLNPSLGPVPHHLREGQVLLLPPKPTPAPAAPDATLTRVRNKVEVRAPEPRPGKPNDPLFRGNRVGTRESSAADLTFRDETQVKLGENTLVVIFGDTQAAARTNAADATLVSGSLRARLSEIAGRKATKPPRIETASGAVVMKNGEAQVSVDEKQATRLAVYKGGSTVTAQKRTVPVDDGFGSKAELGHVPTPPKPLPAAPVWSAPPASLALTSDEQAEVAGTYAPGQGTGEAAAEWHLQLARDADFDDVVVDVRVPASIVALQAQKVPPGSYVVRVSAIDADKFEGKWSPVASFTVSRLALVPLPHGRARLETEDKALACAIDGGASQALPIELARDVRHTFSCARAGAAATYTLEASPIATVHAGADAATTNRVALDAKAGAPAKRATSFEVSGGAGTAVRAAAHLGFTGFVGVGVAVPLGRGRGFVAVRGLAERYPGASVEAKLAGGGTGETRASVTVLGAALPFGYRFEQAASAFAPYVLLAPELARQSVDGAGGASAAALAIGGYGAVGLDERAGPGAVFVEGGFRWAAIVGDERPSVPASAIMLGLGYRLGL